MARRQPKSELEAILDPTMKMHSRIVTLFIPFPITSSSDSTTDTVSDFGSFALTNLLKAPIDQ